MRLFVLLSVHPIRPIHAQISHPIPCDSQCPPPSSNPPSSVSNPSNQPAVLPSCCTVPSPSPQMSFRAAYVCTGTLLSASCRTGAVQTPLPLRVFRCCTIPSMMSSCKLCMLPRWSVSGGPPTALPRRLPLQVTRNFKNSFYKWEISCQVAFISILHRYTVSILKVKI